MKLSPRERKPFTLIEPDERHKEEEEICYDSDQHPSDSTSTSHTFRSMTPTREDKQVTGEAMIRHYQERRVQMLFAEIANLATSCKPEGLRAITST